MQEGFNFIGIEQDADYCEIARRRIACWQQADVDPLQEGDGVEVGEGLKQTSLIVGEGPGGVNGTEETD